MTLESPDLQRVSLEELARACAQQTERFRRGLEHDVRSCFEIFRRAIVDANERAWSIFADQYRFQIEHWAQRHPAFAQCGEELDDLVAHVFSKLWLTFATHKDKLARFRNVQSLMAYCKMCVHSEVVDALRLNRHTGQDLDEAPDAAAPDNAVGQEIWDYIAPRLKDEQERLVMTSLFLYGMGPKDIWKRYPNRFAAVSDIYRVKQNVIARLRRDAEFKRLFGEDD